MWMFPWKFTLAPRQKKKKKKKKKKRHFAFRFSGHLPETNLFFFLALSDYCPPPWFRCDVETNPGPERLFIHAWFVERQPSGAREPSNVRNVKNGFMLVVWTCLMLYVIPSVTPVSHGFVVHAVYPTCHHLHCLTAHLAYQLQTHLLDIRIPHQWR